MIIGFAHFSACIWFFVGSLGESEGLSWVNDPQTKYGGIVDEPIAIQYITSLYFTISALAAVGFGDVVPQTEGEMVFASILMIVGCTIFSYITAIVSSVMHDFDVKASMFRTKMANLLRFLKRSNLPLKMQQT